MPSDLFASDRHGGAQFKSKCDSLQSNWSCWLGQFIFIGKKKKRTVKRTDLSGFASRMCAVQSFLFCFVFAMRFWDHCKYRIFTHPSPAPFAKFFIPWVSWTCAMLLPKGKNVIKLETVNRSKLFLLSVVIFRFFFNHDSKWRNSGGPDQHVGLRLHWVKCSYSLRFPMLCHIKVDETFGSLDKSV